MLFPSTAVGKGRNTIAISSSKFRNNSWRVGPAKGSKRPWWVSPLPPMVRKMAGWPGSPRGDRRQRFTHQERDREGKTSRGQTSKRRDQRDRGLIAVLDPEPSGQAAATDFEGAEQQHDSQAEFRVLRKAGEESNIRLD